MDNELQANLDKLDDWLPGILDQRESDRYKEWFMEAYASVAEAARKYAKPDLSALDGMPPLYEISPKSLPHLEALGLIGSDIVRVTNKRIIESTLAALDVTDG